jgi:ATP phosphoribosyltransferase regulatory subunit
MTATHPALLPAGFRDLLPPEAETEASAVEAVMAAFSTHGYQRVKPPLIEFEDSLLAGTGGAVADQTFRLMDPDTHRPLGVRADMTPQVARIATTRMAHVPRPLRLSYAGQCLRVRAGVPATDRQVAQAGIELIGPDSPEADAELVVVAAEALAALGVVRISFDLTMPPLTQALLDEFGPAGEREPPGEHGPTGQHGRAGEHGPTGAHGSAGATRAALARALDRKDAAAVAALAGRLAGTLTDLLRAAGPAAGAIAALAAAELTPLARAHADRLTATAAAIQARAPAVRLTIDPVEFRGFRYHTGVCTTVYAPGRHEELGRGGRYLCGDTEPAAGITLYPDAVLRAAPVRSARPRVWLPVGTPMADAASLRRRGYATVAGLEAATDDAAVARAQGCALILVHGDLVAL